MTDKMKAALMGLLVVCVFALNGVALYKEQTTVEVAVASSLAALTNIGIVVGVLTRREDNTGVV